VAVYLVFSRALPQLSASVPIKVPLLIFSIPAIIMLVQIVQIVLVWLRWQPMYWFMVGLAVISAALSLLSVALNPNVGTVLNLAGAIVPVVFLLLVQEDFMVNHERFLCAPDPGIHTHSEFYMHGRDYARRKMWALAAVHFRRATAGSPGTVAYHLALATAYAKLKRYERAQSVLSGAQKLAPDNLDVRELSDLIAAARAQIQGAKRSTA
jgi:tetratricopeptide (TPR) repeat protein